MNKWISGSLRPAPICSRRAPWLDIASSSTFDLGGVNQTVGSLSDLGGSGGLVTNSAAAGVTLAIGNNNSKRPSPASSATARAPSRS